MSKIINIRFNSLDPDTSLRLHEFFASKLFLRQIYFGVYPNEECRGYAQTIVCQIADDGDSDRWAKILELVLEIACLTSTTLEEAGFDHTEIEYLKIDTMGDAFTDEEKLMLNFIGGLTKEVEHSIMPVLQVISRLHSKVDELNKKLAGTKVQLLQQAETTMVLYKAIKHMAEALEIDDEEIFPDTQTSVH